MTHQRRLPLLRLLPNMLTITALCAGITAMRYAIDGHFQLAVCLLIFAGIIDGLDGRLARMLGSTSPIGAELDSLCDFVNFGVAPGIVLWLYTLQDINSLGWIAVLIYAVACMMRLARFNLGNKSDEDTPAKHNFQGIPSPIGAMLVAFPMLADFAFGQTHIFHPFIVGLYAIFIGALMIGRFSTPSFKKVGFNPDYARYIILAFVGLMAALLAYPWATLMIVDIGYAGLVCFHLLKQPRLA